MNRFCAHASAHEILSFCIETHSGTCALLIESNTMKLQEIDRESWLKTKDFNLITDLRVNSPELIQEEAARRVRRSRLAPSARLLVLAADHPGRGVTSVGPDPVAMGDRLEYLARIVRVLTVPGVDGVMSTADILDELLLLSHIYRQRGQSLLDDKLLIGCMNRGGLSGTTFEMRDRFGALTADAIGRMRFDGAKMMFRLDPDSPDSGRTIQDCAKALRELDTLDLPAFLEPLPVKLVDGQYRVQKTAEALVRAIGIATALGTSSRRLWLKIPYVEGYPRVARASTCPILMLGGAAKGDPVNVLRSFSKGLSAAPQVRGVLVGRNVLYPGGRDPEAMAKAIVRVVHGDEPVEAAATEIELEFSQ